MQKQPRVLDQTALDNAYLHRDFHGALCYALKYLDENFGPAATTQYLQQVGNTCFAPLSRQLEHEGLPALENHFRTIFEKEGGRFTLGYESDTLVLRVHECPAIAHLKKTHQFFTERFCESTVVVNQTICQNAGFRCTCTYDPGRGRCVQKFWKEKLK
jgi:hypothetical protein